MQIRDIFYILFLNLGCFITLRDQCNNQQPRCDIAWLNVTNHLYQFSELNHGINITCTSLIQHFMEVLSMT